MKRLSIFLLVIGFFSCKSSHSQSQINPDAKRLLDSAAKLGRTESTFNFVRSMHITMDSLYKIKIGLINQAIQIDTSYFMAYWYKFLYQDQLKDDRGALVTAKKALQLKPDMAIIKYKVGLAYDRTGDSVSARTHYQSYLSSCNSILDTMPVKNKQLEIAIRNKINVLILLGKRNEAQRLLNELQKRHKGSMFDDDAFYKARTRADMIKRRDIITWGNFHENETNETN